MKERLLVLGKQTMADKRMRVETVLKSSVQRLKQELLFVKKSALQEVEMMKSQMKQTLDTIVFKQ